MMCKHVYCVTIAFTVNIHQILTETIEMVNKAFRDDSINKTQIIFLTGLGINEKQSMFWKAFNNQKMLNACESVIKGNSTSQCKN